MAKRFTLLGFFLALILAIGSLRHAGLCFEQMRFVPEREKVESAVAQALAGGNARRSVSTMTGVVPELAFRTPGYASAAEFLAAHPNCCRIGPEPPYLPWLVTASGPRNTVVVVDLTVQRAERDEREPPITVRANVTVDACGYASRNVNFFPVVSPPAALLRNPFRRTAQKDQGKGHEQRIRS